MVGVAAGRCRDRQPEALEAAAEARSRDRVRFHAWLQWVAEEQWNAVRGPAPRSTGVLLVRRRALHHRPGQRGHLGQPDATCAATPGWAFRRTTSPPRARTGACPTSTSRPWRRTTTRWLKLRARQAAAGTTTCAGWTTRWATSGSGSATRRRPRGRFVSGRRSRAAAAGRERIFRLLRRAAGIVAEDLGVIPPVRAEDARRAAARRLPGDALGAATTASTATRTPFPAVSLVTTGTHDTETVASGGRRWTTPSALPRPRPGRSSTARPPREVHAGGARAGCWPRRTRPPGSVRAAVAGRARHPRRINLPGSWGTRTGRTASRCRWRSWRAGRTSGRRLPGSAR